MTRESSPALELPAPLKQRLDLLREGFKPKLAAGLGELLRLVEESARHPLVAGERDSALELAHRIHGTAGSYGFPDEGAVAGRVERALKSNLAPSDSHWRALADELIESLGASPRASENVEMPAIKPRVVLSVSRPEIRKRVVRALGTAGLSFVDLPALTTSAVVRGRSVEGAVIDLAGAEPSGGFRVARGIRGMEHCESLPVLFISTKESQDQRSKWPHLRLSQMLTEDFTDEEFHAAADTFHQEKALRSPRIILVDHDQARAARWATQLGSHGFAVTAHADPESLLALMSKTSPDVVVFDIATHGVSGFDLCRRLRATRQFRSTPIVFLSEHPDKEELRLAAYQSGANDYISRDATIEEVALRLWVLVPSTKDLSFKHDLLTNLPNRSAVEERAPMLVSDLRGTDESLSLVLLDMRGLATLNRSQGFQCGDEALKNVARILRDSLRLEDYLGRWGQTEFLLMLPATSVASTDRVVNRLKQFLRSGVMIDSKKTAMEVSVGVATLPADGKTFEALVTAASERLSAAKTA